MEDSGDQSPPTSPRKRLKMDPSTIQLGPDKMVGVKITDETSLSDLGAAGEANSLSQRPAMEGIPAQLHQEEDVGITQFISPDLPGFRGILKKRYTDFVVNEILPSGQVVHLDNLKPPQKPEPPRPEESIEVKPINTLVEDSSPEHARQDSSVPLGDSILAPEATDEINDSNVESSNHQEEAASEELSRSNPIEDQVPGAREPASSDDVQVTAGDKADMDEGKEPTDPSVSDPNNGALQWQAYAREAPSFTLSPEDKATLQVFFSEEVVNDLLVLFNRVINSPHRTSKSYGVVKSRPISDRELRTKAHQEVRRIFADRLDSNTDNDGVMMISAKGTGSRGQDWNHRGSSRGRAGRGGAGRGRVGGDRNYNQRQSRPYRSEKEVYAELGGDYLHFSLCKENKDTMEVVSYLARMLHIKPRSFQFAGTKDRRAVTVQRISVHRIMADRMVGLGKTLHNAKIGNYEYHPYGLELGELTGNEFVITLRDCSFNGVLDSSFTQRAILAKELVDSCMKHLIEKGFLNYYGLQRFGTFMTRTDTIGSKMLQGDLKGAIDAILEFSPSALAAAQDSNSNSNSMTSNDDKARALAIKSFQETGRGRSALTGLPKKFSAEINIIRHLSSAGHANDYQGALSTIPRNLRLMYVHAYQSLIWNLAASYRWEQYGPHVVEGDLVLVSEHKDEPISIEEPEEVDADGEVIVQPAAEDRATNKEDRYERARALTKEEVESDRYSIFDIVLPTPGYDILYPSYMVSFYESTMGSEQYGKLDPHDMRRSWKDISLSGSYRKLLARPGKDSSSSVLVYSDDNEQLVQTDLDRLKLSTHTDQKLSSADPGTGQALDSGQHAIETEQDGKNEAVNMENTPTEPRVDAPQQKLAVIIKLQLGSSQYATMALRELMKSGGVQTYKPDYGGGR